jgi:rhamnose transport system ATP-binding protein
MTDPSDAAPAIGAGSAVAPLVPRLAVQGLSKRYAGIDALADVSFRVAPGEIHALVGENGAGKSTLVKILTGLVTPDAGEIRLDGELVNFNSPTQARAAGVTAVHQDAHLFPTMTVADSMFMELYPVDRLGRIDSKALYAEARRLLTSLGVDLNPRTRVSQLSSAQLQFVGIARALSSDAKLLILDEPTATITPAEAERLFGIMRRLRDLGSSVLFISHRIEELQGLVDSITVLRDGRHVETRPASELDHEAIVRLMVGRTLEQLYVRPEGRLRAGEERLRVEDLSLAGEFTNVSFAVCANEVVTLAGLVGSGRTEIAQTIFGITPATSGRIFIDGRQVRVTNNRQMLDYGVAYLPEDRDGQGLITQFSITSNIVLPMLDKLARFGIVKPPAERALATRFASTLQIKMSGVGQIVSALSGGNRQKVVLAKWLATDPTVLILDEPTHGIDVATKAQVHELIAELAGKGLAILQISSDLPEVLATSDRILVISEGRLVAEFSRAEATQERIMLAATGGGRRAVA